jgi:hypothetical protein
MITPMMKDYLKKMLHNTIDNLVNITNINLTRGKK